MNRILAALTALCLIPLAGAQQMRPITLRLTGVSVREALTKVGAEAGVSFTIKRDVKGTVNLETTRGEFSQVLRDVLMQVDAISEFQNGSYVIRPIKHAKEATPATLKSPKDVTMPLIEYDNADIRLVLKELAAMTGTKMTVTPDVCGVVTVSMKNVSLELVLLNLLKQVDSRYVLTGSGLQISRNEWTPISGDTTPPRSPKSEFLNFSTTVRSLCQA